MTRTRAGTWSILTRTGSATPRAIGQARIRSRLIRPTGAGCETTGDYRLEARFEPCSAPTRSRPPRAGFLFVLTFSCSGRLLEPAVANGSPLPRARRQGGFHSPPRSRAGPRGSAGRQPARVVGDRVPTDALDGHPEGPGLGHLIG